MMLLASLVLLASIKTMVLLVLLDILKSNTDAINSDTCYFRMLILFLVVVGATDATVLMLLDLNSVFVSLVLLVFYSILSRATIAILPPSKFSKGVLNG